MRGRKLKLRKKLLSVFTTLMMILPSFLGLLPASVKDQVVPKAFANNDGLSVTESVDKSDVWRELPEDRLVEYEITVENTACEVPLDVMLVLDSSAGMDSDGYCIGHPGVKSRYVCEFEVGSVWVPVPFNEVRDATKAFIDMLDPWNDRVGLVSFGTNAVLVNHLTDNFSAVKLQIDLLAQDGHRNMGEGIEFAHTEFSVNGRPEAKHVMIVVTNGRADVDSEGNYPDMDGGEEYAEEEAKSAKDDGIQIITVGMGDCISQDSLKNVASSENDFYHCEYDDKPENGNGDGECGLMDIFYDIFYSLFGSIDTMLTSDISDILLDADFWDADEGGVYDMDHTVEWELGTLGCGDYNHNDIKENNEMPKSKTVHFWTVVHPDAPDGDVMENMSVATNTAGGYAESNMVDTMIHTLDKIDSQDPVAPGDVFTYTIDWATGDIPVSDVVIVDYLDLNVDYVSSSDSGVYDLGMHTVTWNLGLKGPHDSGTVTVDVQVMSPWPGDGIIHDDAYITLMYPGPVKLEYETDGMPGDEVWVEEDTDVVYAPVFEIEKTDIPDPVDVGDVFSYSITYENTGNFTANGVQIIDTLPTGLTYVAGTSEIDGNPVGDPTGTNPYIWDLATLLGSGDLAPDGPHTLTFDVLAADDLDDGTVVTDTATITGTYIDPDEVVQTVSASDSEDTTVNAVVLDITKSNDAPVAGVNPGDTVTFTIVVTNSGGADAIGVSMIDLLPDGATYAPGSSTLNGVAVGDPTGTNPYTWSAGTLPANGGSATLTYAVTVDADAVAGVYSNSTYATSGNIVTDTVTSTYTVVIPAVLGEEVGEVLGATGEPGILSLMFGLPTLVGSVAALHRRKR